jgi:hypothetical protein
MLLGVALSWVVARAVFAPGRITYHRVMGAILLYLTIGVTYPIPLGPLLLLRLQV